MVDCFYGQVLVMMKAQAADCGLSSKVDVELRWLYRKNECFVSFELNHLNHKPGLNLFLLLEAESDFYFLRNLSNNTYLN